MQFRPWAVGLFVATGLVLLTVVIFLIGNRQKTFAKHVEYWTEFSNLSGVIEGAKVRVSGADAGRVRAIAIPKTALGKFRLELDVTDATRGMICRDSVALIQTEGVVGDKYILIQRGSEQAGSAPPGTTLPSKEPLEMSDMMNRASNLMKDVQQTVNDARGRLNLALDTATETISHADALITDVGPNINRIAANGKQITEKIDGVITDVSNGEGSVGLLLKDEATRQQIQSILSNLETSSQNLNQASVHAKDVLTEFQSRDLVAKMDATLDNVKQVSEQVKQGFNPDDFGESGASNLRATLSNLNLSTANLADDTEALKHNFLFRGFFKKRGFYNLDRIAPADYLQALAHNRIRGDRKWLPASDIFVRDSNGQQQLAPGALTQIDDQISTFISHLEGHLIIVEGYSPFGTPAQQQVDSRQRADLVRRYLEVHYHLRRVDIGIVALGSSIPPNSGRSAWDGAAIFLVDTK